MRNEKHSILWNDYVIFRVEKRGLSFAIIEEILRYSSERYFDVSTHRMIAVGRHEDRIVMIPYEIKDDAIVPVTVHATTRQQIKFRLKTGRYEYEKTQNDIFQ